MFFSSPPCESVKVCCSLLLFPVPLYFFCSKHTREYICMCLYKALGNINVVDISNFVSYFFYFSVYLFTSRASQNIIIMWDKYTYTCMYVVYISIERTCTHMSVQLGCVIPDFIWFFYYCVSYTTHAIQNTHMLFFIFHSMGGGVNLLFFYAYPRWHPLWSKEEEEEEEKSSDT